MSNNDTKGSTKNGQSSTNSVSGKKFTTGMSVTHESGTSGQQTGVFHEESMSVRASMNTFQDETFGDGAQAQVSLGEFLARPVQLYITDATTPAYAWVVGAGVVGTQIKVLDPWTLWQAIPSVKEKLKYFAYMQGELHVKFVVAGTPFHYGRIQVAYLPFTASDTIYANLVVNSAGLVTIGGEAALMHMSSMLSAEIDPNTNESVEMVLPYVNYKNWMNVAVPETLGSLHLREMVPLSRASDTAVTTINITCFAWMEKVVLSTPTIATATSGKEQPIPPAISNMASAVAAGAGKLESVPVIGRFAKATGIMAGAVGSAASLFGFSKPVNIASNQFMKPRTVGSQALTQGLSDAHKLTLDPLQELTIDPGTVGLSSADEMSFQSIVERECFLCVVKWLDTGGPFTGPASAYNANLLFASNVTPNLVKRFALLAGVTGSYQMSIPTPMSFVARAFNFWRGTIVYRFRVVASTFHKGFLKATYDPLSADLAGLTPGSALATSNLQMTQFLDLTTGREMIMRVPWSSQYPYLQVGNQLHDTVENYSPSLSNAVSNFSRANFNLVNHNGCIQLSIVNNLVAPNGQPAYIIVSSWMEDGEFQCPSIRINQDGPIFTKTSGFERIFRATSGMESVAAAPPAITEESIVQTSKSLMMSQICFGEHVTSIRSLIKRKGTAYIVVHQSGGQSDTDYKSILTLLPQHPLYQNVDVLDADKAIKVSHLTYFSGAYCMRRGAVRYLARIDLIDKMNAITSGDGVFQITRTWDAVSPGTAGSHIPGNGYTLVQTAEQNSRTGVAATCRTTISATTDEGFEGCVMGSYSLMEKMPEWEMPYYGATRFAHSRYQSILTTAAATGFSLTSNPTEIGQQYWTMRTEMKGANWVCPVIYASAGEDYSLFWFLAPPPLYIKQGT